MFKKLTILTALSTLACIHQSEAIDYHCPSSHAIQSATADKMEYSLQVVGDLSEIHMSEDSMECLYQHYLGKGGGLITAYPAIPDFLKGKKCTVKGATKLAEQGHYKCTGNETTCRVSCE